MTIQHALERLRHTSLYDTRRGLWRESVTHTGELLDDRCVVETQLVGLLVESTIDRERASARYAAIGTSFGCVNGTGAWPRTLSSAGKRGAPVTSAREALLVTLALAVFDLTAARTALAALMASNLYDGARAQWNWHWVRDVGFLETDRCADAQLLGAIAQEVLGVPAAAQRTTIAALQKTPLWDERAGLWNWFMTADQVLATSVRPSGTQQLAVIVTALSDREAARRQLATLAASPFYDADCRLWNHAMTADGEVLGGERFALDQLLALLARAVVTGRSPWESRAGTAR